MVGRTPRHGACVNGPTVSPPTATIDDLTTDELLSAHRDAVALGLVRLTGRLEVELLTRGVRPDA